MKLVPPRQARGHDLHQPDHDRRLPVALGAEADAVGHQALDADARQLGEPIEILERVGEAPEAAVLEECAQSDLDPRGLAQLVAPRAAAGRSSGATTYSRS